MGTILIILIAACILLLSLVILLITYIRSAHKTIDTQYKCIVQLEKYGAITSGTSEQIKDALECNS